MPIRSGSVLFAHMQVHAFTFDREFASGDVIHDETRTGRRIQAGEQSKSFRSDETASYKAVTHSPLQAIAAANQVRPQDPLPRKQKRREPLGACPMSENMLTPIAFASMVKERSSVFLSNGIEYLT